MVKFLLKIFLFCCCAALWNARGDFTLKEFPELKIGNDGTFQIDDLYFFTIHWGANWSYSHQKDNLRIPDGALQVENNSFDLTGEILREQPAGKLLLEEKISIPAPRQAQIAFRLQTGEPSMATVLNATLPAALFTGRKLHYNGKTLTLPARAEQETLLTGTLDLPLRLQGAHGYVTFSGTCDFTLLDGRVTLNTDAFLLRLHFNSDNALKAEAGFTPYTTQALDLSSACNMGFRDEIADDRRGGWTDQGSNDLRMFSPGELHSGAVAFTVIDPAQNNDRSCIAFRGPDRDYFVESAEIKFPQEMQSVPEALYLLHAAAWAPSEFGIEIGSIEIRYSDGEKQIVPIRYGIDVKDWYCPFPAANAAVAWKAYSTAGRLNVGLFTSKFPLLGKPVSEVSFHANGRTVWLIVAVSAGSDIPIASALPGFEVEADTEFQPFENQKDIVPGSIFDFSALNHIPAGKYGPVVSRNGHYEFAGRPGETVRFMGANIAYTTNYMSNAECEALALRFRRMGYNAVRIHHYDNVISLPGAPSSTELDPARLERLDYLIHCFKNNGIYVSIDLYTSRFLRKGEIPEIDREVFQDFKALVMLYDSAFENWKNFARNLFAHRNPYTQLTWAEDPVFFNVSVLNEDNLDYNCDRLDDIKQLYDQAFEKYLAERQLAPNDENEKQRLFTAFVLELHRRRYEQMRRFLREELKIQAMTSDLNMLAADFNPLWPMSARADLEYVDAHLYWDHPEAAEKTTSQRWAYRNDGMVENRGCFPALLAPSRIRNLPYSVSEWNCSVPNAWRSECGLLIGALAAFQDWDALFRYSYSHGSDIAFQPGPAAWFDIACDPINLLNERLALLLFRRRDVTPAVQEVVYEFPETTDPRRNHYDFQSRFPDAFVDLSWVHKISARPVADGEDRIVLNERSIAADHPELAREFLRSQIADADLYNPESGVFRSDTGELLLDTENRFFRLVTPRTEAFIFPGELSLHGSALVVNNHSGHALIAATAIDGADLTTARRILVLHLTDIRNTGMRFSDREARIIEEWGKLPLLVRRGEAELILRAGGASRVEIWAIGMDGTRKFQIPCRIENDRIFLNLKTISDQGDNTMAYEMIKE